MRGPEEAVDAETDQAEGHQRQQDRTEGRVVHGAQRVVDAAGLFRVVADARPTEQATDDDEGDALRDVADLPEPHHAPADAAGQVVG
jgi:hypothetical protein